MRKISFKGWTGALARLAVCAALGVAGLQAAPALFAERDAPSPASPLSAEAPAPAAAPPASTLSPRPASLPAQAPAESPDRRGAFPDIQVHPELPITQWLRPGE